MTIPSDQATWTNEAAVNVISRSQDLTLNVSGGGVGGVQGNFVGTGVAEALFCLAPAGTASITVPA